MTHPVRLGGAGGRTRDAHRTTGAAAQPTRPAGRCDHGPCAIVGGPARTDRSCRLRATPIRAQPYPLACIGPPRSPPRRPGRRPAAGPSIRGGVRRAGRPAPRAVGVVVVYVAPTTRQRRSRSTRADRPTGSAGARSTVAASDRQGRRRTVARARRDALDRAAGAAAACVPAIAHQDVPRLAGDPAAPRHQPDCLGLHRLGDEIRDDVGRRGPRQAAVTGVPRLWRRARNHLDAARIAGAATRPSSPVVPTCPSTPSPTAAAEAVREQLPAMPAATPPRQCQQLTSSWSG